MAFPDSNWACGGELFTDVISPEEVSVTWDIQNIVRECCGKRKVLKGEDFSFAGARWNFFTLFDGRRVRSLFGINVQERESSDDVLGCYCDIHFVDALKSHKNIIFKFKCESADTHCLVENFLSKSELQTFFKEGENIVCTITVKKSSMKDACRGSGCREEKGHTHYQLLENIYADIPNLDVVYKVCHDLKQLLLSEECSDVTLQVQGQQFKAHRSILTARPSVFAAMFHHDMEEKATGVVNVEDCEPSAFPVLLEFTYCGSTEKLSVENAFSLYTSADKYDIQDLKVECIEFIKDNLSIETVTETFRLSLQHPETNLLELTIEFFAKNMDSILLTTKWQVFLKENPFHCNEILIKALALWQLKP